MVLHTYKDPKIKCVKNVFFLIVIQYLLKIIVKKMGGGGEKINT